MTIKRIFHNEFFLWLSFLPTMLVPYYFLDYVASYRLAVALEKAKAMGCEMDYMAYIPPEIIDEANASLVFEEAIQGTTDEIEPLIQRDDPNLRKLKEIFDRSLIYGFVSDSDMNWVDSILPIYEKPLTKMHSLLQFHEARYEMDYLDPEAYEKSDFTTRLSLSHLLQAETLILLRNQDIDAACESLLILYRYALLIRKESPDIVNTLTGYVISNQASRVLNELVGSHSLSPDQREDLRQAIEPCLDNSHLYKTMQFVNAYSHWLIYKQHQYYNKKWSWADRLGMPFMKAQVAGGVEGFLLLIEDVRHPYHLTRYQKDTSEIKRAVPPWSIITLIALPNYANVATRRDQAEVLLRQSLLSLRLMEYKKTYGNYPPSLDELADNIDLQILQDPFSGETFGYYTKNEGYVLYSIGVDEEDDHGEIILNQETDYNSRIYDGDYVWQVKK